MTKYAGSLLFLSLAALLGLCLSTPHNNNDGRQGEPHPLESVQLTLAQATSLCDVVSKSGIANGQLYQWLKVSKQQAESQAEPATSQQEGAEKQKGECLKIGFTPCLGKARFPLQKDCGFYSLISAKEEECTSSSSRSKRSISDAGSMSMSLSHGEALHLCHTIQAALPASPDQINYVAIKIHPTNQTTENENEIQIPHPSENCVAWTYKPCMTENEVDCNVWHKKVKPAEKCASFHSENPDHYPKHPQTSSLDSKLAQEISSSSLPEMDQVIQCKSAGFDLSSGSIQCQILPVGTQPQIQISTDNSNSHQQSRAKRHLGCGPSGPRCCCGILHCHCCCSWDRPGHGVPDQGRWWWGKK